MQQICIFLARHEKTCFSTEKFNKFALFWRVKRKPAFPLIDATNLPLFGASRENLLFHVIMQQICIFLARHEKPAFPLKNATICTFLSRHEKTCFSTNRCNKFAPFWRVTRKPATKRNNATNLHIFGASRENLLFHVTMQQICKFLACHEKPCLFT